MLQPKKRKYRKDFRGRRKGVAHRGTTLAFGDYGIKALDRGWLASNQIEAGRRAITNALKRKGRVWIRVFPDKPVSSRPAGQRMGSGKGEVSHYVAVIKPGRMIFEVAGVPEEVAREALRRASDKMPFKSKFIIRETN